MARLKPVAVGLEDYKRMVGKPYYYVDKTLFLRDLIDKGDGVKLFTRPRRFGKTLVLSMVKAFFEMELDASGNVVDNRHYFDGMKIMGEGERYTGQMGQYPVVSLSLKSAKQPDFTMAYGSLLDEIRKEYERHMYVLEGDALLAVNKEKYLAVLERRAEPVAYAKSLAFLSECLKKYHGRNTVILLDEYDVPLENAYVRGFYEEMADFIRSLFESALKTNDCLEFAVVTGCLRISKESIFTGLNNPEVVSAMSVEYAEYFGFTEGEAFTMLDYYGLGDSREEMKAWYDGYLFGKTEVYNPWSVILYIKDKIADRGAFPKPYWSNTSSNSIVKELVEKAGGSVKKEIEDLIAGHSIEKAVHEDITYGDIHKSQDNLWNFLFFTGYLKAVGRRFEGNEIYAALKIPNEEVRYIYCNTIREWFRERIGAADFSSFYRSLMEGEDKEIEEFISRQLSESISYYDNAENFYHGYLVGILSGLKGYEMDSNKGHGDGRPDILLGPFNPREPAVIIELKCAAKYAQMEGLCEAALGQIEEKRYGAELMEEGYRKVLKYGFCFCKKACMVKHK